MSDGVKDSGDKSTDLIPIPSKGTREVVGIKLEKLEKNQKYKNFIDVSGKQVTYENVDFSYSVFERGYFHKSVFKNCNFTGVRFFNCNFRTATFESCDFKYSDFQNTIIPADEVFRNLPTYPNVRRDLLQSLRKNSISVGDYEAEKKIILLEIEAKKEHLRNAIKQDSSYYQQKYGTWQKKLKLRWSSATLWFDGFFWGHGEKLLRVPLFLLYLLIFVSVCQAVFTHGIWANTGDQILTILKESFLHFFFVLFDVPNSGTLKAFTVLNIIMILAKFLSLGVVISALFRRLSHR